MASKLKKFRVDFISLVGKPANRKSLILKDKNSQIFEILKTDDEKRRAYGIVYAPNEVDSQGDYADASAIWDAQAEFMKNLKNQQVDENHDFVPTDAYVAESWIVRKNDEFFPENPGAWAVGIQIESSSVWEKLKKGELTGLSMAGFAEKTAPAKKTFFGRIFNKNLTGENEMDEKIIKSIEDRLKGLTDTVKALSDQVEKMAKPLEKQEIPEDVMKQIEAKTSEGWEKITKILAEALAKSKDKTNDSGQKSVFSDMI
jgi:hypothetical protein